MIAEVAIERVTSGSKPSGNMTATTNASPRRSYAAAVELSDMVDCTVEDTSILYRYVWCYLLISYIGESKNE